MRRQSKFIRSLLIILIIGSLAHHLFAQPVPSTNQPIVKFKAIKNPTTSTAGLKPATLLMLRPHTNPPVIIKFLAISRAPSPYDECLNVETVLIGTESLDGVAAWQIEQHAHTNQFVVTNDIVKAHYWRAGFALTTNL